MKGRHGENIDSKRNLKEYWRIVKEKKWLFFLLIFITILAEVLNTAVKFLYKRIIDDSTLFASGDLARDIFVGTLVVIASLYFSFIIARSVAKWFSHHILMHLDTNILLRMKRKYFNHIVDLSHEFHTTHKTGSLISRMIRGAGAVENMTDILIFNFIPLIINLIVVSISIAYFSLAPAIVIAATTIIFVIYSYSILNCNLSRIKPSKISPCLKLSKTSFKRCFFKSMFDNIFFS